MKENIIITLTVIAVLIGGFFNILHEEELNKLTPECSVKTREIVSLGKNQNTSGSGSAIFILGIGWGSSRSSSKNVYVAYEKLSENSYQYIEMNIDSIIIEKDDGQPRYLEERCTHNQISKRTFTRKIVVPIGTITKEFNL